MTTATYRQALHDKLIEGRKEVYNTELGRAYTTDEPTITLLTYIGKALKPDLHYRYINIEQRDARLNSWINGREETARFKQEMRAGRKVTDNPFKPDDIFHHSWGYDQTQCDFYQVVEVRGLSLILRPIASRAVEGSEGFMSESRLAVKDAFIDKCSHALTKYSSDITPENPTITKRVRCHTYNGKKSYFISTPYGWCSQWEGKPEYCSWYA